MFSRTCSSDAPSTSAMFRHTVCLPPSSLSRERERLREETERLVSAATEAERQRGLKLLAVSQVGRGIRSGMVQEKESTV